MTGYPRPDTAGIIYYVARLRADRLAVKIGFSGNATRRAAQLGGSLLAWHHGTGADEAAVHARFAGCALGGEWFAATPELLAHIAALATDDPPPYVPPQLRRPAPPHCDPPADLDAVQRVEYRFVHRAIDLRRYHGWSQEQVAERTRATGQPLSRGTVLNIEKHRRQVHLGEATALAEVFGVSFNDMIGPGPLPVQLRSTSEI
jgi:DNA-binding XRE family transcriptional regulator